MIVFVIFIVVLSFGLVVFFGAPYLPTLNKQARVALDLLDLKPGQTLLELGSGDGRVMRLAGEKGLKVIGYELNPILVIVSYFVTFKYRKNTKIIWGNYWTKNWPEADGVFVFLLDNYMKKLDDKLNEYGHKPIKLVSFTFQIMGKKPIKSSQGIFLYKYK